MLEIWKMLCACRYTSCCPLQKCAKFEGVRGGTYLPPPGFYFSAPSAVSRVIRQHRAQMLDVQFRLSFTSKVRSNWWRHAMVGWCQSMQNGVPTTHSPHTNRNRNDKDACISSAERWTLTGWHSLHFGGTQRAQVIRIHRCRLVDWSYAASSQDCFNYEEDECAINELRAEAPVQGTSSSSLPVPR